MILGLVRYIGKWLFGYSVFFQAEDGIRDKATLLEFRRVLFRSLLQLVQTFSIGMGIITMTLVCSGIGVILRGMMLVLAFGTAALQLPQGQYQT